MTVHDPEGVGGSGASTIPRAVWQPLLARGDSPVANWATQSWRSLGPQLEKLAETNPDAAATCGVFKPARDAADAAAMIVLLERSIAQGLIDASEVAWLPESEAGAITGHALQQGGLWIPRAGWLHGPKFCAAMLDHPNIQSTPEPFDPATHRCDQDAPVVLANSAGGESLAAAIAARNGFSAPPLPSRVWRGQLTHRVSPSASGHRSVLTGYGVLCEDADSIAIGSTFDADDFDERPRDLDDQANVARWTDAFPSLQASLTECEVRYPWVGFRSATAGRLPIVGPVPNVVGCKAAFGRIWRGGSKARTGSPQAAPRASFDDIFVPGLWVTLAHGARGATSGPHAGQVVAAAMTGNIPMPTGPELRRLLLPVRALERLVRSGHN